MRTFYLIYETYMNDVKPDVCKCVLEDKSGLKTERKPYWIPGHVYGIYVDIHIGHGVARKNEATNKLTWSKNRW